MPLRRADLGLIEAGIFVALRTYARPLAAAAAVAAGITLPTVPLFETNYVYFILTLFILLWMKLRGETWGSIGLVPPRWSDIGWGVLLFVAIVVYSSVLQTQIDHLVSQWTGTSRTLAAERFADIKGNLNLFLLLMPFTWAFAAFGEEVFYRGYLMTRIAQFMGEGRIAWTIALVAQACLFGAAHAYQGPVGMVGTAALGIFFGLGSLIWGRRLWPAMLAHGLADTLGFWLMYAGLYGQG